MQRMSIRYFVALGLLAAVAILVATGEVWAANGAYVVDAADISDLGSCKLESWLSAATNTDYVAVANPTCVVDLGKPVELSTLVNRYRSDGDSSVNAVPKVKFNIEPTGIGKWGYSFLSTASFDLTTGQNQNFLAEIPATYRLSETMRINVIAGWFWDRVTNRQYLSYGAGFDWKITKVWEYTIEAFGLAGSAPSGAPSTVRPRLQTGIRYRPNETFSIDLIYGFNITGENAHWITVGTTILFPPPGSASPKQRD